MLIANDNLYTLPLTSTGYVRRETKKAMFGWAKKHKYLFPDIRVFDLLEEAFRGGDTHANRYYSGTVIKADGKKILGIGSFDRSSSYPDVVLNDSFPMSKYISDHWKNPTSKRNWITEKRCYLDAGLLTLDKKTSIMVRHI